MKKKKNRDVASFDHPSLLLHIISLPYRHVKHFIRLYLQISLIIVNLNVSYIPELDIYPTQATPEIIYIHYNLYYYFFT